MHWHEWSGWYGMGSLMMVFMLVFWALVIAALVFFIRWLAQQGRGAPPGGEGPLEILKKRYARGEISLEEYQRMRRDLE